MPATVRAALNAEIERPRLSSILLGLLREGAVVAEKARLSIQVVVDLGRR